MDTSSQDSVPETEASIESNPIHDSPTAVANSSHSDSPAMDLLELQANAHLAINHMLSIKRSLELKRQWAIWDFEALLHQWEAEAAAANERAKIVHSRKDLQARVKCTKVVMRAKYDYQGGCSGSQGQYGAMNSKRQKPPIQRPSMRMQLQSHSTAQHFIGNMQST